MLKRKILIKITGSIAAYKSAYLISKLVQSDFEVKTVVTESALQFIGKATLEGLTESGVYSDTFESNKMMSHINLIKWADLTIVVPADANTINKFANGIGDNLITSLFLANDFSKPYLIAPAMNTKMYNHPATKSSLKILEEWGVKILPTAEGHLACGDEGAGKLLDPDKIYDAIIEELARLNKDRKKVLITGGGTIEHIDGVRYITNLSSGKTAGIITDFLFECGHEITYLKSETAVIPHHNVDTVSFNSFQSLNNLLKTMLKENEFDAVIHLAAISDYTPLNLIIDNEIIQPNRSEKISSSNSEFEIKFRKNDKIIDNIKKWSCNKKIKLFGFKFSANRNNTHIHKEVDKLFINAESDFVVFNSLVSRKENVQKDFEIISPDGNTIKLNSQIELARHLNKLIME